MAFTYPPAAPSFDGDSLKIHRFLQNPTLVAKRVQDLLQRRYIADVLLSQRLSVQGGAVVYESGEPLGTDEHPRAVAPGSEFPLVSLGSGTPSVARTTKWGQDAEVTDEAIKRLGINPVNRGLTKLANQNVMHVDGLAMSAISSAVTTTKALPSVVKDMTAEQILTEVLTAKAQIVNLEEGYDPNTVALDAMSYAFIKAKFIAAGYLPREGAANAIKTGDFPTVEGMLWLPTPHGVPGEIVVADTEQLGGMADEDLGSPGYVRSSAPGTAPVEVKTIRKDENDMYRMRARRVTVPVVLEPRAALRLTGAV